MQRIISAVDTAWKNQARKNTDTKIDNSVSIFHYYQ